MIDGETLDSTHSVTVAGRRTRTVSIDSRVLLVGVIALIVVLRWLPLRNNGWFLDDNLYLVIGHQTGFGYSWLMSNLFEHFGPLYRLAWTAIIHLMPMSWRWGLVGEMALLAGSVFLLDRCLRLLIDSTWTPLLMAGAFGLSVLLIEALEWISSGLQNFPTAFGDLLCFYGYLRYIAQPSRRWILVSAGGMAFALLFYEKASFMIGYLPLIRILLMSERVSLRGIWRTFLAERAIWIALVVVLILWYIGVKVAHAGGIFITPSVSEWVTYWRIMWGQTLVPGVFGLHIPWYGVTHQQVIEGIVLEAVVLAAIVFSIVRKRVAWRAWAILILAVLANGILVAEERVVVLKAPASIGGDTRYLLDFTWLVPVLLCLAFSRREVFWPNVERLSRPVTLSFSLPRARWLTTAVAVGAAAAYIVAAQLNTVAIQRAWIGTDALQWEQNVLAGIKHYTVHGVPPTIADATTPYEVLGSIYTPYDHISYVLPFYSPGTPVDGPIRANLLGVNALGGLQPVVTTVRETFPLPHACVSGGTNPDGYVLINKNRIAPPASEGPFYLLVNYTSATGPIHYLGTAWDPALRTAGTIDLPHGVTQSIDYIGDSKIPFEVNLQFPAHTTVCFKSLQIVTLALS